MLIEDQDRSRCRCPDLELHRFTMPRICGAPNCGWCDLSLQLILELEFRVLKMSPTWISVARPQWSVWRLYDVPRNLQPEFFHPKCPDFFSEVSGPCSNPAVALRTGTFHQGWVSPLVVLAVDRTFRCQHLHFFQIEAAQRGIQLLQSNFCWLCFPFTHPSSAVLQCVTSRLPSQLHGSRGETETSLLRISETMTMFPIEWISEKWDEKPSYSPKKGI